MPAVPDAGAPLAQSYGALATRAESGDRDAAERLVTEFDACRHLPRLERDSIEIELRIRSDRRALDGPFAAAIAQSLAGFEARAVSLADEIETRRQLCAGIDEGRLSELGHWLYRAAELGDAKAALRYGDGSWISTGPGDAIDDMAIEFWRTHALEMMQRALTGGELSAATEMALSFWSVPGLTVIPAEGQILLYAALPQDPGRAITYLRIAAMTGACLNCDAYELGFESDMDPAAIADAHREADRICATDLAGRCTHASDLLTR